MTNHVYIATSLDGFIADRDGKLGWLPGLPDPDGGDYGFAEFLGGIDAIVMGRRTFETVLAFGLWPYDKPVFVLSHTLDVVPEDLLGRVEIVRDHPRALVDALRERGYGASTLTAAARSRAFSRRT